uniref:Uncharacterized protein n=1 Tax=Cucumis melo TaxID=3656 RepID=A0A9I9EDJ1_CUCME
MRQIEEELLDHITIVLVQSKQTKRLEGKVSPKLANSQHQKIWFKSSSIFQQRIQENGPTSKHNFLTSRSIVLVQPGKN